MSKLNAFPVCLLIILALSGCGGGETILPTDELTAEQLEQIQREDASIEDEEEGGGL